MTPEEILERRGVKPTANRILVVKTLLQAKHPMSLAELELKNLTMDKSSIFRVLTLIKEHDVVHTIEDGSGSVKYELCHSTDAHSHSDMHVHFYCESCQQTFCFDELKIPEVSIPDGFHQHSINYMIKGVCPKCAKH